MRPECSRVLLVRLPKLLNMNFISVLSCLSLLLAAAASQTPKPCEAPLLMSGGLTVMTGSGLMTSTGTITYDALGQRMRVRHFGYAGNETFALDNLMLFNQKVYYEVDWSKFSCKKKPLDTSFIPMRVPTDAKLMGQVFLGSSSSWGMGVLVNNWYGALPNSGMYNSVFTEIGCIPLTFTGFTPESGWVTISTFNWVLGNTNPMDYSPPFFCAKSKLEETDTPDNMFTALKSLAMKTRKQE